MRKLVVAMCAVVALALLALAATTLGAGNSAPGPAGSLSVGPGNVAGTDICGLFPSNPDWGFTAVPTSHALGSDGTRGTSCWAGPRCQSTADGFSCPGQNYRVVRDNGAMYDHAKATATTNQAPLPGIGDQAFETGSGLVLLFFKRGAYSILGSTQLPEDAAMRATLLALDEAIRRN